MNPSTFLFSFLYALTIANDLSVVAQDPSLKDALYVLSFVSLAACVLYLFQKYGIRNIRQILSINKWLYAYLVCFVAIQFVFHQLSIAQGARIIGYAGTAVFEYTGFAAILYTYPHLFVRWLKVMVVFSCLMVVPAIAGSMGAESFLGFPLSNKEYYTFLGFQATGGILEHPLTFGTQMVLGLASALFLHRRNNSWVMTFSIALLYVGLFLSMARGAWLAAMVGGFYFLLSERTSRKPVVFLIVAPGALMLVLAALYRLAAAWPALGDLFRIETGLGGRKTLWDYALGLIADEFLVGYGFGSAPRLKWLGGGDMIRHSADAAFHNNFIDMALQSGVLVAALYFMLFALPIYRLVSPRSCIQGDFQRTLLYASVAMLVSVIFVNYNIGGLRSTSLSLAIFLGMANLSQAEPVRFRCR